VRLQSIELREFRNHREARFDLRGDSALVLGENGSGKTNLIEAVVLLSIGKSFRGSRDPAMARRGAAAFEVRGLVEDRLGVTSEIIARGGDVARKEFLVDREPLARVTAEQARAGREPLAAVRGELVPRAVTEDRFPRRQKQLAELLRRIRQLRPPAVFYAQCITRRRNSF